MNIDLQQIQALLRLLEKRDVTEFEFEDEHVRLRLVRGQASFAPARQEPAQFVAAPQPTANPSKDATPGERPVDEFITSPFVGTF